MSRSPAYYAWRRFRRNRTAFVSLLFVALCTLVALLGYTILPDASPDANRQSLEQESLKPGTTVKLLRIRKNAPAAESSFFTTLFNGRPSDYEERPWQSMRFSADSVFIVPFSADDKTEEGYALVDVAFALSPDHADVRYAGDVVYYNDLNNSRREARLPQLKHEIQQENLLTRTYLLGTDPYGRDMLSRLLLGARISLAVGFISVTISLIIGILLGALAGFFRGWVDAFILWLINVVWSIPTFLLVMAVSLVLGRGFWQVFVAVGLTMWVEVARLVRGQILSARELEYVQAARALGFRNGRIIFRHILPNILGPVMVIAAANFATAILLEAGLSFLGLGVQPPTPSWGVMINDHYGYIVVDAAYLALLPGMAILLLVLAFNLLGNGLRDALDVRMRD